MGGGGAAIQQAGLRQHKRARADSGNPPGVYARPRHIRPHAGRNFLWHQLPRHHQRVRYDPERRRFNARIHRRPNGAALLGQHRQPISVIAQLGIGQFKRRQRCQAHQLEAVFKDQTHLPHDASLQKNASRIRL